uniref:trypsin-like peptidase domain-containing protein n=1 Tax=Flavobacterium sp. TaxID=239 RepID=UPI004049E052
MKNLIKLLGVAFMGGVCSLLAFQYFIHSQNQSQKPIVSTTTNFPTNHQVGLTAANIDFTAAAEKTLNNVVHVKNVSYRTVSNPIMEYFYGYRGGQQQQQIGTGSGVIISEDGFIVTNNHVINGAQEIEVTLNNNESYAAKLIGTDSKMDIALLKIEADKPLSYAVFSDSDQIKVGEWVLAVGNPYNLNSTVTAGIISAKARNLDNNSIQSFIQTDAAVNPGNSGGALVNTRGELIGINTMISSNTGSYVGYSFAVPSNITKKIVEDLIEFGNVQRGILGVEGIELNGMVSKELNLSNTQGFLVKSVNKKSGAEKGGIEEGDIITKIDNQKINSFASLTSYLNSKRPNDTVQVTVIRDDETVILPILLTKKELINVDFYGLELEDIDATDKKKFRIDKGVRIKEIKNRQLSHYREELEGSIILSIEGNDINDVASVSKQFENKPKKESIMVELLLKNGKKINAFIPSS